MYIRHSVTQTCGYGLVASFCLFWLCTQLCDCKSVIFPVFSGKLHCISYIGGVSSRSHQQCSRVSSPKFVPFLLFDNSKSNGMNQFENTFSCWLTILSISSYTSWAFVCLLREKSVYIHCPFLNNFFSY